jgi:hypothetical protein
MHDPKYCNLLKIKQRLSTTSPYVVTQVLHLSWFPVSFSKEIN